MGISAVLLAYREAENLKILLPKIKYKLDNIGEKYEIIVIDTAEPLDNTEEICELNGAHYYNQEEHGFGGAFRTAIHYATMDKFLILDSDGSHNPEYITNIYYKFIQGYDVVIGSRYVKGGHTDDSRSSVIMSRILNTTFRYVLGINAKDISTDFRMYNTKQLKNAHLTCSNYDILQEVLMKMKLNNPHLKIGEIPIRFHKRVYGESKRRLIPFILSYIVTLIHLFIIRFTSESREAANDSY